MADFYIKQGDLYPLCQATLKDGDGNAIDLSAATGVKFHMNKRLTGVSKVNAAATIVTAASGIVRYAWTGTDTSVAGTFNVEWEITWAAGGTQTVPNDGYDEFTITPELV